MYIQTESTPNPDALKFLPENIEVSRDNIFFQSKEETVQKSKLAFDLFGVEGIKAVFFGNDFITITKDSSLDWLILKPEILMIIMDHFVAGFEAMDQVSEDKQQSANYNSALRDVDLSEIEKQIIEIIETRVRPNVQMDGGDIVYVGYKDNIVFLQLQGSCSGCPSSSITLKNGIESMLKHYIPEVERVEAID